MEELIVKTVIMALIGAVIGIVVGIALRRFHDERQLVAGDLRIDTSDPDGSTYLFLELSTDLNTIKKKKYVKFKVNTISYIPRQ